MSAAVDAVNIRIDLVLPVDSGDTAVDDVVVGEMCAHRMRLVAAAVKGYPGSESLLRTRRQHFIFHDNRACEHLEAWKYRSTYHTTCKQEQTGESIQSKQYDATDGGDEAGRQSNEGDEKTQDADEDFIVGCSGCAPITLRSDKVA